MTRGWTRDATGAIRFALTRVSSRLLLETEVARVAGVHMPDSKLVMFGKPSVGAAVSR